MNSLPKIFAITYYIAWCHFPLSLTDTPFPFFTQFIRRDKLMAPLYPFPSVCVSPPVTDFHKIWYRHTMSYKATELCAL